MAREFTVGQGYSIEGETAFYLGAVDGVNLFQLAVDKRLHVFYFAPAGMTALAAFEQKLTEVYTDAQLPEDLIAMPGTTAAVDATAFQRWTFAAKPAFANAAFCPTGQLELLCARQGDIVDAKNDLTLGKRYRGLNPDYCVLKDGQGYRQTGLREQYPELVLQLQPFVPDAFRRTGLFPDTPPVYVLAKSVESFGGKHAGFGEWQKLAAGEFAAFFAGGQLATWRRRFVLTPAGETQVARLGLTANDVTLLTPAK
ncbi:MAG TPA: hypothetical protein PKM88_07415 [bacterium]|nr:hypothetical protein [bacterium]